MDHDDGAHPRVRREGQKRVGIDGMTACFVERIRDELHVLEIGEEREERIRRQ